MCTLDAYINNSETIWQNSSLMALNRLNLEAVTRLKEVYNKM